MPKRASDVPRRSQYDRDIDDFFAWCDKEGISLETIAAAYQHAKLSTLAQIRTGSKPNRKFLRWALDYRQAYLPPDTTAPVALGSYNRKDHMDIEGRYQLIRPSTQISSSITATDFSILWSSKTHCFTFSQAPQPGPKFLWDVAGNVAFMTRYNTYHFVSTDNTRGRHQIMSAIFNPLTRSFRALSGMVPLNFTPICLPVVLIPWDASLKLNDTFAADHPAYSEYKRHLHQVVHFDPESGIVELRSFR